MGKLLSIQTTSTRLIMDAVIIYLKDGAKAGKVEISVEVIGDPVQSLLLADTMIGGSSTNADVHLNRDSVFIQSPSERLQ
jgi:hypothetical protein